MNVDRVGAVELSPAIVVGSAIDAAGDADGAGKCKPGGLAIVGRVQQAKARLVLEMRVGIVVEAHAGRGEEAVRDDLVFVSEHHVADADGRSGRCETSDSV